MVEVDTHDSPSPSSRSQSRHFRFAGRFPVGIEQPVTVRKKGVHHIRRLPSGIEEETLSIGLACSECFSGPRLARVLKPGFDYEAKVMQDLLSLSNSREDEKTKDAPNSFVAPLSIHTSAGVPEALDDFIEALGAHLPWSNGDESHDDWCLSLQIEGASAVWAAIDMLLQTQILSPSVSSSAPSSPRLKVAVAETSYHGPPSTSFGHRSPLWHKHHQVTYPTPKVGAKQPLDEEGLLEQFERFLKTHGSEIGVILVEPQWGSSQAALPWPRSLLSQYIKKAKEHRIQVLCDEIMCGLGRHGHGTLFVSKAWDLDPDAVTFGKAIGGGVFPISGAIVKKGRTILSSNGKTVLQSHTYAGSSVRALMTATEVLRELPPWFPIIARLGKEMQTVFTRLEQSSNSLICCQGQGLMWGGYFTQDGACRDAEYRSKVIQTFKKACGEVGVLPYHVPTGGFMVSPVYDVDTATIQEMEEKLSQVLSLTMQEVGWNSNHIQNIKSTEPSKGQVAIPVG